jgi:uncharacterized protein HemX
MTVTKMIGTATIAGVLLIGGMMAGVPRYSVWQQEMSGKAEFAKAEQNRKIKIQEAKAMKESAEFYAQAEIIRAKGVAQANQIIGKGLKGNDEYLRYLWIQAMGEKDDVTTVYVPIGNDGLPIMKSVK